MPLEFYECFGQRPSSPGLAQAIQEKLCPFVGGTCSKAFGNKIVNGACTLIGPNTDQPTVCCPKRLYADNYRILRDTASLAFGADVPLVLEHEPVPTNQAIAIPFGQKQGHEIRVPYTGQKGSSKFSVDWIIAHVNAAGELEEFIALEVQTIDTTGNYQLQYRDLAIPHDPKAFKGHKAPAKSSSSFNFENVNKRILPQLITKGHILRRESLCKKGLFFVCPAPVLDRILQRVGDDLPTYPQQTGSVTFIAYQLDLTTDTYPVPLKQARTLTTTTDQLSLAFSSPKSLPEPGVYESAIREALSKKFPKGDS